MDNDPERGKRFMEICRQLFHGASRSEIAKKLGGVSVGTIRNWEAGRGLSRTILSRLENLGVSLEYLLDGAGTPLAADGNVGVTQAAASAEPTPVEALAANMRHLRKIRFPGWGGQRKFAEFLGISANDLCIYEYGRALPNEQRLEDMAHRLGLEPDALLQLLPGVVLKHSSPHRNGGRDSGVRDDHAARTEVERLRREMTLLQARNEILQERIAEQEARIKELTEMNFTLRSAFYMEDTPEGAERRRALLQKVEASLSGKTDIF